MLRTALRALVAVTAVTGALSGCGGGSSTSSSSVPSSSTTASRSSHAATTSTRPTASIALVPRRQLALPAARAGGAAAAFGGRMIFAGGLSAADVSTDTVFALSRSGAVTTLAPLPSAIHDAAAAPVGARLLVFGGGVSEGSDHILQVVPGPPRHVGTLPQALSDLVAAPIGGVAYVTGGWNGTATNRSIYAVADAAHVRTAGALPLGVRYPAAGALGGRLIVAGGEMTSGEPTDGAWAFDPRVRRVSRLPRLPAPTDHAAGVVLAGRFYVVGGLRRGTLTRAIISWAPGERHWRRSGALPVAVSDASAIPYEGGIAVAGGRAANGRVATITVLAPG